MQTRHRTPSNRLTLGDDQQVLKTLDTPGSPLVVSPWWLACTAFVGAKLMQFGFTQVCPLGWMLRKAGVPEAAPCAG